MQETLDLTVDSFGEDFRTVRVLGKGDKEVVLPVGKMAAHFLKFYAAEIFPRLNIKKQDKLFLSTQTGKVINKNVMYGILRSYANKLFPGQPMGTHIFRYSACTHLGEEGVDIRIIQEFMRHEKPSTTMRYIAQSFQRLQSVHKDSHPRA